MISENFKNILHYHYVVTNLCIKIKKGICKKKH